MSTQTSSYEVRLQLGDSNMDPLSTTSQTYTIEVDNRGPNLDISSLTWQNESDPSDEWQDISEKCPVIERNKGEDVHIRMTFRAWGEHFRSVEVEARGCENHPKLTEPSSGGGSPNKYTYWHKSVGDREHKRTVEFTVPSGYQQGGDRIKLRGVSRAFNPAGSGSGPGPSKWEYDNGYIDSHLNRLISIADK